MLFWKWKEKCEEVEGKLEVMREDRDDYKNLYNSVYEEKCKLRDQINERDKEISKLEDKIEDMQGELDILNGHYKLDIAEDEESRLQVKRDVRVYRLELENMELRRKVRELSGALEEKIKADLARLQINGFSNIMQNYRPW